MDINGENKATVIIWRKKHLLSKAIRSIFIEYKLLFYGSFMEHPSPSICGYAKIALPLWALSNV